MLSLLIQPKVIQFSGGHCNNCFFISALLLRVHHIAYFGMLGCRQIFIISKGCREPQKVEKHCSSQF